MYGNNKRLIIPILIVLQEKHGVNGIEYLFNQYCIVGTLLLKYLQLLQYSIHF